MFQININHITSKNSFLIESYIKILTNDLVCVNYDKWSRLCKAGCKNYNFKYSCPPSAPEFINISKSYKNIVINVLKVKTDKYEKSYNTIRMLNSVLKAIQRKIFDKTLQNLTINEKSIILENGSCRLCKKCNYTLNIPCRHPDKMRFSLEATGVDVNDLLTKAFDFELEWYKTNVFPNYQCVVGGILTNNPQEVSFSLENNYKILVDYK